MQGIKLKHQWRAQRRPEGKKGSRDQELQEAMLSSRRFCILLPSGGQRAEGKRSDLDVGSLWTLQASLLEL